MAKVESSWHQTMPPSSHTTVFDRPSSIVGRSFEVFGVLREKERSFLGSPRSTVPRTLYCSRKGSQYTGWKKKGTLRTTYTSGLRPFLVREGEKTPAIPSSSVATKKGQRSSNLLLLFSPFVCEDILSLHNCTWLGFMWDSLPINQAVFFLLRLLACPPTRQPKSEERHISLLDLSTPFLWNLYV